MVTQLGINAHTFWYPLLVNIKAEMAMNKQLRLSARAEKKVDVAASEFDGVWLLACMDTWYGHGGKAWVVRDDGLFSVCSLAGMPS